MSLHCIKNESIFPETAWTVFGGDIKVKVDLSNYATIIEIKIISHANTSSFASKTNLASLKTEFAKLDTGKLTTVPADLSNLSDVVKNEVV